VMTIFERSLGRDHTNVAELLVMRSELLVELGRSREAKVAHARAQAIRDEAGYGGGGSTQ
jgi:hypothetical protein